MNREQAQILKQYLKVSLFHILILWQKQLNLPM